MGEHLPDHIKHFKGGKDKDRFKVLKNSCRFPLQNNKWK